MLALSGIYFQKTWPWSQTDLTWFNPSNLLSWTRQGLLKWLLGSRCRLTGSPQLPTTGQRKAAGRSIKSSGSKSPGLQSSVLDLEEIPIWFSKTCGDMWGSALSWRYIPTVDSLMEQKKENEVRISRLIILLILIFADIQFLFVDNLPTSSLGDFLNNSASELLVEHGPFVSDVATTSENDERKKPSTISPNRQEVVER